MHFTKRVVRLMACTMVFGAGAVFAQEQGTLTQAQWSKRIGESAQSAAALERNVKLVPKEDRVDFTRRTLKAVTRLPLGPKAKTARYVESSILCVADAPEGDGWFGVIAESIAIASVPDLPALVKELSSRINPKRENMTADAYKTFADKGVDACIARNAQAEDPKVRNTFAILLFSSPAPDLQESLVAKLADTRTRELATTWLADAAKDDYTAILAAADVQVQSPPPAITIVGSPGTDRLLLSYLGMTDSAFDAILAAGGTGTSMAAVDIQTDSGFRQTPLLPMGYQNQGMLIRPNYPGGKK